MSAATTTEYLSRLDSELCFTALEFLLTLLASQSLLALKDVNLSQREKQLIKRELSTELSIFYDFVKKRILRDVARDEPLHRKKHGIQSMSISKEPSDDSDDRQYASGSGGTSSRKSISSSDRMRISVTRKLHLQSQPGTSTSAMRTPFNMTHQYSPIGSETDTTTTRNDQYDLLSSTPAQIIDDDQDIVDMQLHHIEDPIFCELSFIQFVEEDYLHFLSNLFSYICHTEKIN